MAYCAFMYGRLITLDKQPGVSTVGVGETWRYLFAKISIKVTVLEATMACQDGQICDGLKAVIYVTVHRVQSIWDKKSTTGDWGLFLVDIKTLSTR